MRTLTHFFRFLAHVDNRSRPEVCDALGIARVTFDRYRDMAQSLGVVITYSRRTRRYSVDDQGPIDIRRIARLRLGAHSPGQRRMPRSTLTALDLTWASH